MQRRERTRRLIELGGLVQKSGLVDLLGDDRSAILGALLDAAGQAGGDGGANVAELWRRRGQRAFEAGAAKP